MICKPALKIYLTFKACNFWIVQTSKSKKMYKVESPSQPDFSICQFPPLQQVIAVAGILLLFLEIVACTYMPIRMSLNFFVNGRIPYLFSASPNNIFMCTNFEMKLMLFELCNLHESKGIVKLFACLKIFEEHSIKTRCGTPEYHTIIWCLPKLSITMYKNYQDDLLKRQPARASTASNYFT